MTALSLARPTSTSTTTTAPKPKRGRRVLRIAAWTGGVTLAVVVVAATVFVATPSPIHPLAWNPAPAPALTGVLAPNNDLAHAELVTATPDGPEDITFDTQGNLYTGDEAGTIYRVTPDGHTERYATTGGRPNGLRFAPNGHLIVADTRRGLLDINPTTRTATVLTDTAGGQRLALTNELAVTTDGTVYFSDSSNTPYATINLTHELLQTQPTGRLLRYDPHTHHTDVILTGLNLANGVTLAPDQSYVLVNETFRYRITRYWLTGPKTGTHDLFADNLPGFPDNLATAPDGTYWVGLYQPRNPTLDTLQSHTFLKAQLAKLPDTLLNSTTHASTALQLSNTGQPLRALTDTTGHIYGLTTATPHNNYLYLGTDHKGSNDVMRIHL